MRALNQVLSLSYGYEQLGEVARLRLMNVLLIFSNTL